MKTPRRSGTLCGEAKKKGGVGSDPIANIAFFGSISTVEMLPKRFTGIRFAEMPELTHINL